MREKGKECPEQRGQLEPTPGGKQVPGPRLFGAQEVRLPLAVLI